MMKVLKNMFTKKNDNVSTCAQVESLLIRTGDIVR